MSRVRRDWLTTIAFYPLCLGRSELESAAWPLYAGAVRDQIVCALERHDVIGILFSGVGRLSEGLSIKGQLRFTQAIEGGFRRASRATEHGRTDAAQHSGGSGCVQILWAPHDQGYVSAFRSDVRVEQLELQGELSQFETWHTAQVLDIYIYIYIYIGIHVVMLPNVSGCTTWTSCAPSSAA